ncbi:MAG: metal-sensing transcriptional repressor [Clostridia bacterium]|nr:metal-sensing transcriptional repressor [Clostridia bacterium]
MSDCCKKARIRSEDEIRALTNRLKRIEGQVRGVCSMVESDAYCVDILTQVAAIRSALTSFSRELLESHIKGCVVNDIKSDRLDTLDELMATIERFMK